MLFVGIPQLSQQTWFSQGNSLIYAYHFQDAVWYATVTFLFDEMYSYFLKLGLC